MGAFCFAIIVSIPLLVIFLSAFRVNYEVWAHIYDYLIISYVLNSLFLVIGVVALTLFIGLLAAWFIVFYDVPFKKLFSTLLVLPIAIPPYAVAYCYADITDKGGSIDNILSAMKLGELYLSMPTVRSLMGATFILSLTLFPYIFLILKYSFQNNALKIIESAANLGVSKIKLFFNFALPISRPAFVASITLVVMETLADFGVVSYLGINTLSVGVYKAWFGFDDLHSSARLSVVLLIFTLSIILIEKYLRRNKKENYTTLGQYTGVNSLFNFKTTLPTCFLFLVVFISFIVPIYWLIANVSLQSTNSVSGVLHATFNSFKVAFIGAFTIISFAIFIIFTKRVFKMNTLSFIINFSKIGYAAPGIVIAIGVISTSIFIDKQTNQFFSYFGKDIGLILSGSIVILIFAYLVRFLSVAFNPIESGIEKISEKIDYSALNLGANKKTLLFKIHLPMIFSSCLIAFLLIFIDILKELPITLILRPFNYNTLSVLTFEYASSEQLAQAALPALLITIIGLFPLIFINKILNNKEGKTNEYY
jgi:iron(III) transport system permease protein